MRTSRIDRRVIYLFTVFVLVFASAPFTPAPVAIAAVAAPTDIVNIAVYAKSSLTSLDTADFKLNMTAETLDTGSYPIVAMSIDGGNKWSKCGFDKTLKKLFDKGGTLWITDELDAKGKVPASVANVVKWGAIQARPKPNPAGAKVFYLQTVSGSSLLPVGCWVLSTNNSDSGIVNSGYELTKSLDVDAVWQPYIANEYEFYHAPEPSPTGRTAKETYLFRVPATDKSAGSKPWKVIVSSLLPPTKYKIDYKNETIKLKAGDYYVYCDESYSFRFDGVWIDETKAYSVSDIIDNLNATEIRVWSYATVKKQSTIAQIITLLPRAEMPPAGDLIISQGNLDKTQIKPYEFSTNGGKTWGKLPKINTSYTGNQLMVRVKPDTKAGLAASKPVNLEITYGKLNTKDSYMGITSATIVYPTVTP